MIITITKLIIAILPLIVGDEINYHLLAKDEIERCDFVKAELKYNEGIKKQPNNAFLKKQYYDFLVTLGEFVKIIQLKDFFNLNKIQIQSACNYRDILNSKDDTKISKLLSICKYNPTVLLANAKILLKNGSIVKASGYVKILENSWPNFYDLFAFKARIALINRDYPSAAREFQKANDSFNFSIIENFIDALKMIANSKNVNYKRKKLLSVFSSARNLMDKDRETPNLYQPLVLHSLELIIELHIENDAVGGSIFSNRILSISPSNPKYVYKHIRLLLIEGRLPEAEVYFKKNSNIFSSQEKASIDHLIFNKKQALLEEEKRKEEEAKRQKAREEEEESRRVNANKTNKAGTDFMGYYKMLGLTIPSTTAVVKKAWKKATRNAHKDAKKNKKSTEELEKRLTDINKAYDVLFNEKNKKMYDNGIDPDDPYAGSYGQGDDYGNSDFFKGFEQFFQSGGGNGRGYRRIIINHY